MLTGALVALVTLMALPAFAQAAGTITVKKAGSRVTASNSSNGYASALEGAVFEFAPYSGVTDPRLLSDAQLGALTWQSHTCATVASGSCTLTTDNNGGTINNGRYLVREKSAPAGWDDVLTTKLNYSGGSSGASPARNYLADVTISNQNDPTATVFPGGNFPGESGDTSASASQLFIDVKDNPAFPQACGLNVMLLLDESGSIGSEPGEKEAYRDAAQAFVNALAGTPTKLKVGSFAESAAFQGGGTGTIFDLDTTGGASDANAAIANVYSSVGGGTNWDAGMQLAATNDPSVDIDLVVFITDGNPTVRQPVSATDSSNTSGNVNLLDLSYGIASANIAKAAEGGQKILSVGVGSGVTKDNLKVMSGPNEFPANQTNPDFAAISNPEELASALKQLANLLCGARIHVRKLTDGDPNPSSPRAGWTFDPAKTVTTPIGVTLAPDPLVTDGTEVNDLIRVDGIPVTGAPGMTLAETMQAGYGFAASECKKASPTDPNRWPEPADGAGTQTLNLATVLRGDDLWCTFRNKKQATVTIVKRAVPQSSQDFSFTTTGLGGWAPVLDDDGVESTAGGGRLSSESRDVTQFGQKTIAENAVSGWDLATLSCQNGTQTPVTFPAGTATIDVQAGDAWVCTFTNKQVNVTITKVATDATISAGDEAQFTITVTNNGPGTARAVKLTDPLPAGLSWTVGGANADACVDPVENDTLDCSFGDLASGQSRTITLTAMTSEQACATYPNVATVSGGNFANKNANATITCSAPNVTITKIATDETINAGEEAKFTITVTNNGPGTAKAVKLSDPLPAGLSWTVGGANAGSCVSPVENGTLDCSFGDLASGQSRVVTLTAMTGEQACASYPNLATVSGENFADKNANATITCSAPNVTITKVATPESIDAGEEAKFTITVTNNGPGTAKAVKLSDPLPAGLSWTVGGANAGSCVSPVENGTLDCSFGDLASGQSRVVTLTAMTGEQACASYPNLATVSGGNFAAVDADATIYCSAPEVAITKVAGDELIDAGDEAKFTITVTNNGPGSAKAVKLSDPLPAGLDWTAGGANADACVNPVENGTLDCSFGDLASGQSRVVTLTAMTSFQACASYPNLATVSGGNFPATDADASIRCRTPAVVRIDKVVLGEPGSTTKFAFSSNLSPNQGEQSSSFDLSGSDPMAIYTVRPGEYQITESDPRGLGYVLTSASCAPTEQLLDSRANVNVPEDRTVELVLGEGDDVTCTFTNTKLTSAIDVVKSPKVQSVYADGSASYTYKVTNTGTSDLSNVSVGDDKCSPLTRTDAGNNDALNLLEAGESWTYTCSVSAAKLFGGSSAPVTNTVTASGVDRTEKTVTDTDTAVTNLLVPGIAIDKTGPASAEAGTLVTYNMAVTNIGNTSFAAANVKLTDTVVTPAGLTCSGDLTTPKDKKGDQTPNELNPGETWIYQCQVQTTSGQTLIDNRAQVSGTDSGGKTVNATDTAQTTLTQPNVAVKPLPPSASLTSRARLLGSVGCVTARYARATVSGSPIQRVTFYVNGKQVKRLSKPNSGRRFQLRYRTKSLKYGTYKVRAVVRFKSRARPQSRTMRLQFSRCRPRVVRPTFTG